jgi:putative molybdopterin biosynthesis protein
VLIHWAERTQGLIMRREDEKKLTSIAKLKSAKTRVVMRQPESGGFHLFNHLLATASVPTSSLNIVDAPALTDTDLAQRIRDGEGDVGLGCEASALGAGLAFVPLAKERFDVLMRRRDFFEPPLQALFVFARSAAFRKRAEQLGGYDVSHTGSVVFNP